MVNVTKLGYFVGEYKHNLTEKNRVSLPKRFRIEFEGNEVILAKGEGGAIEVFDKAQWKEMVKVHLTIPHTEEQGRLIRRRVFSSAMLVELDSQGRMVLSDHYLSWAGLKSKAGELIVIVGVGDHIEMWKESGWLVKQKAEEL